MRRWTRKHSCSCTRLYFYSEIVLTLCKQTAHLHMDSRAYLYQMIRFRFYAPRHSVQAATNTTRSHRVDAGASTIHIEKTYKAYTKECNIYYNNFYNTIVSIFVTKVVETRRVNASA